MVSVPTRIEASWGQAYLSTTISPEARTAPGWMNSLNEWVCEWMNKGQEEWILLSHTAIWRMHPSTWKDGRQRCLLKQNSAAYPSKNIPITWAASWAAEYKKQKRVLPPALTAPYRPLLHCHFFRCSMNIQWKTKQMATESPILDNHLEMAEEMARWNPWAFDGGSQPGQPSVTSQPAKRSPCPPREGLQHQTLLWLAVSTKGWWQHSLSLPTHTYDSPPPNLSKMAAGYSLPLCRLLFMHPVGAQFSLPSQIRTKLRILPVSAVYHFEIYTILAERTELYCIHDAIKHFTRNQCKTDEAWK